MTLEEASIRAAQAAEASIEGAYERACELWPLVIDTRTQLLGDRHLDTLVAKGNLGTALYCKGDFWAARQLLEPVFQLLLKDDANYLEGLRAWSVLAMTYLKEEDFANAKSQFEAIRMERARLLGEDHPDTLLARCHLASVHAELGEYELAEREFRAVLAARQTLFGEEDERTLGTMQNVAAMLYRQGAFFKGLRLQQEAFEIALKTYGADGRITCNARKELLAQLVLFGDRLAKLSSSGGASAARSAQERLADSLVRIVGERHLESLRAMHNFALTLCRLGERLRAQALLESVRTMQVDVLGHDHPETLRTVRNLLTLSAETADSGA